MDTSIRVRPFCQLREKKLEMILHQFSAMGASPTQLNYERYWLEKDQGYFDECFMFYVAGVENKRRSVNV